MKQFPEQGRQESSMPKDCSTSQKPAKTRKPECRPCGDTGFLFPRKNVRHFCGCLKGIQRLRESCDALLDAAKSALSLFDKDHALSRFDWGASFLRAEDIRELNELPGKIRAAIAQATGEVR